MKNKIVSLLTLLLVASCSSVDVQPADPNPTPHDVAQGEGVFSKDGNLLEGFKGINLGAGVSGTTMAVNQYLWKSTIKAVSFMPLIQADSAGGVILSDWVEQAGDVNKQVKINVYILSQKLEPNALDVKVFERTKLADGSYSAQKLDQATAIALEETILSNARALKIKARAK